MYKQNKKITQLLLKYSDQAILAEFQKAMKSQGQLTAEYQNNPSLQKVLINNIVQRNIDLRDALLNPILLANQRIIEQHHDYFFDPSNIENAQMRGFQFDMAHRLFSSFGYAGNGIEYSGLSAESLSSSIITKRPYFVTQGGLSLVCNPESFKHSVEYSAAKAYSSIMQNEIVLTNDDPNNIPKLAVIHNNMPKIQTNPDYVQIHDNGFGSLTDLKAQSLCAAVSPINILKPRIISVGSINFANERKSVSFGAHLAITGQLKVYHADPRKNNPTDLGLILGKLKQSGEVEDAKDLIGFPIVVSNRHIE